jgi:hypothetical protein
LLVEKYGMTQEQLQYLEALLHNPDMDEESATVPEELYPYLKLKAGANRW